MSQTHKWNGWKRQKQSRLSTDFCHSVRIITLYVRWINSIILLQSHVVQWSVFCHLAWYWNKSESINSPSQGLLYSLWTQFSEQRCNLSTLWSYGLLSFQVGVQNCLKINIPNGNDWIFRIGVMGRCQKMP